VGTNHISGTAKATADQICTVGLYQVPKYGGQITQRSSLVHSRLMQLAVEWSVNSNQQASNGAEQCCSCGGRIMLSFALSHCGRSSHFALIRFHARRLVDLARLLIPHNLEPRVSHLKESRVRALICFGILLGRRLFDGFGRYTEESEPIE